MNGSKGFDIIIIGSHYKRLGNELDFKRSNQIKNDELRLEKIISRGVVFGSLTVSALYQN